LSERLTNALKRRAASWAGQLTRLAKSFAPDHLKPYIFSRVEQKDSKIIIRTTANRKANPIEKYGSADARAQEYGSGLHARRDKKGKYPIRPKEKKILAFYWEVATRSEMEMGKPGKFTFAPDGRVLMHQVNHPGIKAANNGQGYIRPAIKELKRRGKTELKADIRQAILGDLRQSFGGKSK
jgi:hypothetical protein